MQTPEQYLFTYIDTKGNVNKPVHIDYLNYKMRSVENRHKLRHATPHKFSIKICKIGPENIKVYLILDSRKCVKQKYSLLIFVYILYNVFTNTGGISDECFITQNR